MIFYDQYIINYEFYVVGIVEVNGFVQVMYTLIIQHI